MSQLPQSPVTRVVTPRVVQGLESVDVEVHRRHQALMAMESHEGSAEPSKKELSVGKPRQGVGSRRSPQSEDRGSQSCLVLQQLELSVRELPWLVVEDGHAAKHESVVDQRDARVGHDHTVHHHRVGRIDGVGARIGDRQRSSRVDHFGAEGQRVRNGGAGSAHGNFGRVGLGVLRDDVDDGHGDRACDTERGNNRIQIGIAQVTMRLGARYRSEPFWIIYATDEVHVRARRASPSLVGAGISRRSRGNAHRPAERSGHSVGNRLDHPATDAAAW